MANPTSLLFLSWLLALAYCILTLQAHSSDYIPKTLPAHIPKYPSPQNKIMNIIDSCWRSNPKWSSNRQALADCAIGFGSSAIGGKYGAIYVVTDPSDNPVNPTPGTLRYGAIQTKPLWIIFDRDMVIKLKNELMVTSYKTLDGRGAKVEITDGPCITLEGVSHVIIHGLGIHDCTPGKPGMVRSSLEHVMLLGHRDGYTADKVMKVTVVFNHFGPGLVQRMPRVRYGYAHVANNKYDQWLMYAIGGSSNPTILSEGNYFMASNAPNTKEVTKRETEESSGFWKNWKWRSSKDVFVNGAYFVPSGMGSCAPLYSGSQIFSVAQGSLVPALTSNAGPLQCVAGKAC
ncbi:hypothetical protein RJ639_027007 [Escallonia herrerae]|uniref:Pectate lyase n=1 Tax=Escallonia herrerae TaxID=1293975 RepID=A0AA88X4A9_9ASTE|nr:hypothetical protein RJ639_027007 [Escallonia herrerae]